MACFTIACCDQSIQETHDGVLPPLVLNNVHSCTVLHHVSCPVPHALNILNTLRGQTVPDSTTLSTTSVSVRKAELVRAARHLRTRLAAAGIRVERAQQRLACDGVCNAEPFEGL
jgi:hypothetical protein